MSKSVIAGAMFLVIAAGMPAISQGPPADTGKLRTGDVAPDLRIVEYVFAVPNDDKAVKAYVVDDCKAAHQTSMSGPNFALVAARFKNAGGNYSLTNNDKVVLVRVLNAGKSEAGACRLMLTVRKINNAAAGRQKVVTVPQLAPGKDVWLIIDASSILPNDVSLESTTFKLNADATSIVAEANENNNEVWHNL